MVNLIQLYCSIRHSNSFRQWTPEFLRKKNDALEDVTGYNLIVKVGVNENAVVDNISTKVKLYINDETFFSGRITNESPFFLVFMKDESDINTGGGMS